MASRVLPWLRRDQHQGDAPSLPAWGALAAALTAQDAAAIADALRSLVDARQSLGTVTLQQAQQLLDALAWLSRAPQGPDFSATGVTSALALLCRWAKQLTQPGQGSSSDTQLLQTAVDVVLQLVAGGTPLILTAHTQAAALLFLATAFPRCSGVIQQRTLSGFCSTLVGSGTANTTDGTRPTRPLASLSACYDACAACDLLLAQLPPPSTKATLQDEPCWLLITSLMQGASAAAASTTATALHGTAPHIAAHSPPATIPPQPPTTQTPFAPQPQDHAQFHGVSQSHVNTVFSAVGIDTGVLYQRVCVQIAVRTMAAAAAVVERWAQGCATHLTSLPVAQAAAVATALQAAAARLQAECSAGLQSTLRPAPAAAAAPPRAPPMPTVLGAWTATARVLVPTAFGVRTVSVVPVTDALADASVVLAPSPAAWQARDATRVCMALLCSAALLRGVALGLRASAGRQGHIHTAHERSAIGHLHPALSTLSATIQSTLAAVAQTPNPNPPTHQQNTQTHPHHTHRSHTTLSLLRSCCGYVYGDLSVTLETVGLQHLVAVPGPVAVEVPAMVCECLSTVVLNVDVVLLGVVQGVSAAGVAGMLREQVDSDALYARVTAMGRAVVSAAQRAAAQPAAAAQVDSGSLAAAPGVGARLLDALGRGAAWAERAYTALTLVAPRAWLADVASGAAAGTSALRGLLDKLYVTSIAPLPAAVAAVAATPTAAAAAAAAATPPHADTASATAAAAALAAAAAVSFCAVQLDSLTQPLAALVPRALAAPAGVAVLFSSLPCYQDFIIPLPTITTPHLPHTPHTPAMQPPTHTPHTLNIPRWETDSVLAAKLAFLLPILTAAACTPVETGQRVVGRPPAALAAAAGQPAGASSQAAAAASSSSSGGGVMADSGSGGAAGVDYVSRLLPTVYLYLKHPQGVLAGRAHAAYAALAAYLCDTGRAGAAAQSLVYYVQRSLQTPWTTEQLDGLEQTLPKVMHVLSVGCPEVRYAVHYLISQAVHWYRTHTHGTTTLDFSPLYLRPQHHPPPTHQSLFDGPTNTLHNQAPATLSPQAKLVSIAVGMLFVVDWQLLPDTAEWVGEMVHAAGLARRGTDGVWGGVGVSNTGPCEQQIVALLQLIQDMVIRSDDYVRKDGLVAWLQGMLGSPEQHPGALFDGLLSAPGLQPSQRVGIGADRATGGQAVSVIGSEAGRVSEQGGVYTRLLRWLQGLSGGDAGVEAGQGLGQQRTPAADVPVVLS